MSCFHDVCVAGVYRLLGVTPDLLISPPLLYYFQENVSHTGETLVVKLTGNLVSPPVSIHSYRDMYVQLLFLNISPY